MPAQLLPGTVQNATPISKGFDIDAPLTAAQAKTLKDAGYEFCIRYIPRTSKPTTIDLTHDEALIILNAGLALMAVQHASPDDWKPTTNLGTAYGSYAASYAKDTVGLPPGVNIWCDLEMVAASSVTSDIIAYCQAWFYAVHAAGYVPGVYVGANARLTAEQLYDNLSFQHYWRAYNGPSVATRGYQILQHTQVVIQHMTIDPNTAQNDELGDVALWLKV